LAGFFESRKHEKGGERARRKPPRPNAAPFLAWVFESRKHENAKKTAWVDAYNPGPGAKSV
jgi:hypothetical protein